MNDEQAYRLGICIVAVGEYGRDIINEYKNETNKKIKNEYLINIYTEKEIDLLDNDFYIIVGDFEDPNTQTVITKLTGDTKSKKYLLIKNLPFMKEENVGIINASSKKDVVKSLEVLTYFSIKPSMICIDEADIWRLANSKCFQLKSIKGTTEEVKEEIKKIDKINETEAVLINIIVSKNTGLHEINIIAEAVQKVCSNDSQIVFYYTCAEKMQEGNIEINLLYSIIKSA